MEEIEFGLAMFAIGVLIGIVLARMGKPLFPSRVFTWRGMLIGAVLLAFLAAVWPIILVSRSDGIGAEFARLVLSILEFSAAMSLLVAVVGGYKLYLFNRRLEAIERHVFPKAR